MVRYVQYLTVTYIADTGPFLGSLKPSFQGLSYWGMGEEESTPSSQKIDHPSHHKKSLQ